MVNIYLNGEPIHYKDWSLFEKDGEMMLCVMYPSEKKYMRPYKEWEVKPTIERKEDLLVETKSNIVKKISSAIDVGGKYFLVQFETDDKIYKYDQNNVHLQHSTEVTKDKILNYYRCIAQERLENAKKESDKVIAQSVVAQFDKIIPYEGNVLHTYLSRKIKQCEEIKELIYPFGINETQKEAVKKTFQSQISIIEGPPGTGKTQTILNIIANIVVNNKTCAIVSNNNSAVENVYEKLKEKQLDFLVAKLGKEENRELFFQEFSYEKQSVNIKKSICKENILESVNRIERHLAVYNELAQVRNEIREIEIEKKYLEEWGKDNLGAQLKYIEKYKLNRKKVIDLFSYLKFIRDKKLTLRDKWELLFQYKIFNSRFLKDVENRESFIYSLQYTFYGQLLQEKVNEEQQLDKQLQDVKYEEELKELQENSMHYLYQYLHMNIPDSIPDFTVQTYRKNFSTFVKYFPVVGSSTHSLLNSIATGYMFDYVIIDEASQQDLVPGILCFGCAKNVVIVGDRKQLTHIPVQTKIEAPDERYDCFKYSLLDSIVKIFEKNVSRTLLKEHYRCHPKIIQFCNQEFYDNQLISMKEDKGEEALVLISTSLGNHTRNTVNQREIESLLKANEEKEFWIEKAKNNKNTIGFIAPYRKQVDLAEQLLPVELVKNTVHKFQGRECNTIVFSTVLDKKISNQWKMDFVDNAELVNVAVSRAKDQFVLVTGQDVFKKRNKHIAALIRHIEYYSEEKSIINSPVISAFDLLYTEYDASLERVLSRLKISDSRFKSEQIVATLLRDILGMQEFHSLTFHKQIYLKQLVLSDNEVFDEREKQYIRNRASCDFVLYYRIGKKPLAVIEVDGGYHNLSKQMERDVIKNNILEKAKIPLLRLKTVDSEIREKIKSFIRGIYE